MSEAVHIPLCVYCGTRPGNTRDHVVPRSYLRMIADAVPTLERPEQHIVPACGTCNSIAGSRVFSSFEEKRAWLRGELRRRKVALCDDDVYVLETPAPPPRPRRITKRLGRPPLSPTIEPAQLVVLSPATQALVSKRGLTFFRGQVA